MIDRKYKRVRILVEMDVGYEYTSELVAWNVAWQMNQLCAGKNITTICDDLGECVDQGARNLNETHHRAALRDSVAHLQKIVNAAGEDGWSVSISTEYVDSSTLVIGKIMSEIDHTG